MHAPLIFCSARKGINISKIFKIILSSAFRLKCAIPEVTKLGEPILEHSIRMKEINMGKGCGAGGSRSNARSLSQSTARNVTQKERGDKNKKKDPKRKGSDTKN